MADKRSNDKPSYDAARVWIEHRKQKAGTSASFAPLTPPTQRAISTFSSPGSLLGKEDDVVIIELTPRHLQAGIEGDSGPQCKLSFSPEGCRRVGDYRQWMPGHRRKRETLEEWASGYELWRDDVEGLDLELLTDRLERTVREAYNKHLLVDAGTSRLVLVLPSLVPHPVLESILFMLFQRWKYPVITLLPSPTMAVVAAGLRSGLVVDIGWEETVVTSIYEYREVSSFRSTRAMRVLTKNLAVMMKQKKDAHPEGRSLRFDLELVEEVLVRTRVAIDVESQEDAADPAVASETQVDKNAATSDGSDLEVEWPGERSSFPIKIERRKLKDTFLATFLGEDEDDLYDDHELPLPSLMFKALLSLPPDLRGVCMSRIVFTGHNAESRILRQQVLKRLESIIQRDGWNNVRGRKTNPRRSGQSEMTQVRSGPADAKHDMQIPAGKDYVEESLQKQKAKTTHSVVQGTLREVHSLGPWTGASLLSVLKIRGFVEIDRERFLSHGISGANRETEISMQPQQRMSSFGLPTSSKITDRNSWTLAGWG